MVKHLHLFTLVLALFVSACQPIAMDYPSASDEPNGNDGPLTLDDPLPMDPDVRIGTLDNGLTYYIRHNTEPMNRAELWLGINAGSVQEDDDQLGLAHFLEHMLFNGTERFEGQALIDFFETVGMEFGPDVNAYTSFDETVYNLQIPTDDPEILETAFDVLEDWAAYASLTDEEVDKERGVVVEEWRLRDQNANGRINDKLFPVLMGDSQYTERMPIGDMEIIRNAPTETVRRFYETWYRPDLTTVIAVGDFDVDEIEDMIKDRFSSLPTPENPVKRPTFDVPEHDDTRYIVIEDPEQPFTQLQIIYKKPAAPLETVADFKEQLTTELFYQMLNARYEEIRREVDAPFVFAGAGAGGFIRPLDADFVFAQVDEEGVSDGLEAIMVEVERARQHGFTATELERSKADVLRSYEDRFNERENINHQAYAGEYLNHYLEGEAIASSEIFYTLAQQLLAEIEIDEVNQQVADLVTADNRVVLVLAPEKEAVTLPTEEELIVVIDGIQSQKITPFVDQFVEGELIAEIPEPAEIVAEQALEALGVTEIELANGVRVLMKPTDFKDDEVLFTALSPGGSSLVSDEDFIEADSIVNLMNESGVGDFNQTELEKLLAGKSLFVNPYIGELYEGFNGQASPEDLETALQLIHLYATAPRVEESALAVFQNQWESLLANLDLSPDFVFQEALTTALYGETVRRGLPSIEDIQSLDLERAIEIYQDRFADASDFTFIFVGSFEVETLKPLVQSYLGTLPSTGRAETWKNVEPALPDGIIEKNVYKGIEERSIVQMIFTGEAEITPEKEVRLSALERILDIVLREDLREERGGTYSPFVSSATGTEPEEEYFLMTGFSADPNRVQELTEATFEQIGLLQSEGPAVDDLEKAKAQLLSGHEESLEQNGYWLSIIEGHVTDPGTDIVEVLDFESYVEALTVEDIQNAAQSYLPDDRYVKVSLFPESFEETSE